MIRAAIVGLGRWGQNLVDSVQGKSDKIRFVTGVLRHPDRARAYADKQGLALEADYRKVLADPGIDAIVLATPHTVHGEQIMAALAAGKPVFTEKPFTLASEDAVGALRAAAQRRLTLGVGFNWRFQPALQEIRRMLDDGRLGKLLHIEGNFCGPSVYRFPKEHWRQQREEGPAGGMTGRGVHVVDAMLYLAGPVASVTAQSDRIALDYGIDDTTSMLFRFRGGATGYLGTIISTAETWRMQVFGSRGWVEVGDVEHLTTWQMRVCSVDPENLHTHQRPHVVTFPPTSTERAELEHFADAVRAGRPLAVEGGDEQHGVAVLEAILESARSGRSVPVGRPVAVQSGPAKQRAIRRPGKAAQKGAARTAAAAGAVSSGRARSATRAGGAKTASATRRTAKQAPVRAKRSPTAGKSTSAAKRTTSRAAGKSRASAARKSASRR
jgi:predicted dehydrogenase